MDRPGSRISLVIILGAVLCGAFALGRPARVLADGPESLRLTADDVARRAAQSSFQVLAGEHERDAASAVVDQARAGYVPRLTGGARYARLSNMDNPSLGNLVLAPGAQPGALPADTTLVAAPLSFPVLVDQYSVTAALVVPVSDYLLRVPHAVESAEADEHSASFRAHATRLQVAADARVLYYDWVRSRLQLDVANQTLEQTRAHLVDARRLVEVGLLNQADVLSAESQVAQSELLLERATSLSSLNEQRLRTAMHDQSGVSYAIGENVDAELSKLAHTQELRVLHERAIDHRLELKALAESARALNQQAKLARAAQLPRLDAVADATYANPNQRVVPARDEFKGSWTAGAVLSWTPSDIPAAGAQGRSSDARASAIDADRHALADAIGVEIAAALQAQREAEKAIDTSQRRLRSAEEAYRVRTVLFQNGRATGVEVTDAETELARARLDLISSRVGLRIARVQLDHAAGMDVQ